LQALRILIDSQLMGQPFLASGSPQWMRYARNMHSPVGHHGGHRMVGSCRDLHSSMARHDSHRHC
jgi:hypothetical protein